MSLFRHRGRFVVLATLATAVIVIGWHLVIQDTNIEDGYATPALLTGVVIAMLTCGLAAEWRRPHDPTAWLVVVVGVATAVADFRMLRNSLAATLGALSFFALPLATCHLLLALPDGLARDQRRRVWYACWIVPAAFALAIVAFSGARRAASWVFGTSGSDGNVRWLRQNNPLHLATSDAVLYSLWAAWSVFVLTVGSATVMLVARRIQSEARPQRRPLLFGALGVTVAYVVAPVAAFPETLRVSDGALVDSVFHRHWYADVVTVAPALAVAVIAGWIVWNELVRPRLARLGNSTIQLASSNGDLNEMLGRSLGDATARVLFPRGDAWVTSDGRVAEPAAKDDRAATIVTRDGVAVAAIEHDRMLLNQIDLVDVAVTSVALSLESGRLAALANAAASETQAATMLALEAAERGRAMVRRRIDAGPRHTLFGVRELLAAQPVQFDAVHQQLRIAASQLRDIAHGVE